MKYSFLTALMCAALSSAAFGQAASESTASLAAVELAPTAVSPGIGVRLPANSELILSLNSTLNTKINDVGDRFALMVAQDVRVNGQIVIPRGTRAVGQVTWATGNGGFGKSDKMEVAFRYLDLNGQQIPLEGTFFQEGKGKTGATIGAVALAGIAGGLMVKGKEASIPEGREFTAHLGEDVPFLISPGAQPQLAADYVPSRVSMQVETEKERKRRLQREKRGREGER